MNFYNEGYGHGRRGMQPLYCGLISFSDKYFGGETEHSRVHHGEYKKGWEKGNIDWYQAKLESIRNEHGQDYLDGYQDATTSSDDIAVGGSGWENDLDASRSKMYIKGFHAKRREMAKAFESEV